MLNATAPPLNGSVDTVYYSYHFRSVYMFTGEDVYELVAHGHVTDDTDAAATGQTGEVDRRWAGLRRIAPWYNIWFDICDVE